MGAKQPKGIADKSIFQPGAKVGDIYKVEIEQSMDGIDILAVIDDKKKSQTNNAQTIEIGIKRDKTIPKVTLTPADTRHSKDSRSKDSRSKDSNGSRKPRTDTRIPRRNFDRSNDKTHSEKRRPTFLKVNWINTDSLMQSLSLQEKPIAEFLVKGGMPAVRAAIKKQNDEAKANNLPEVAEAALVSIAEKLLPQIRKAQWQDRATAALEAGSKCPIRELKSLLAAADLKDDSLKDQLHSLKTLVKSVTEEQISQWKSNLAEQASSGDVKVALELLATPPDRSAKIEASLLETVVNAVNAKLASEVEPDQWIEIVELIASSSLRTKVNVAKIPFDATGATVACAKKYSGFIPSLAPLLGLKIPPPPRISKSTLIISQ